VLLAFEIGNNREVEHAEVMLEDIEGSILLADRCTGNGSLLKK
jgi:hypothetical protein